MLYYNITDHALFHQIKNLNENYKVFKEDDISIKSLFKWAFDNNNINKFITLSNSVSTMASNLTCVETLKETNPDIIKSIHPDMIKNTHPDMIKNTHPDTELSPSEPNMMVLYGMKWSFKFNLVDGWEDFSINMDDLIMVSKKEYKQKLYIDYIFLYKRMIKEAIEFRKKHYDYLNTPSMINVFNKEFLSDFISLYKILIEAIILYNHFKNSLSWFEKKRFEEYNKKLGKSTNINININWKHKSSYSL